jgi:hypothetical protein
MSRIMTLSSTVHSNSQRSTAASPGTACQQQTGAYFASTGICFKMRSQAPTSLRTPSMLTEVLTPSFTTSSTATLCFITHQGRHLPLASLGLYGRGLSHSCCPQEREPLPLFSLSTVYLFRVFYVISIGLLFSPRFNHITCH